MPTSNFNKPAQLGVGDPDAPALSRPGGATSRASSPVMQDTRGAGFAAMTNALLGKGAEPAKLTPGSRGRQFKTIAASGKVQSTTGGAKVGSIRRVTRYTLKGMGK